MKRSAPVTVALIRFRRQTMVMVVTASVDRSEHRPRRLSNWYLACLSQCDDDVSSADQRLHRQSSERPSLEFPSTFFVSTALILLSSVTFEMTRRALRQRKEEKFTRWLGLTAALGIGFLIAQLLAWRQLIAAGFFVNTNRHSGFAYIFTGLHAVHLLGGIIGLAYVVTKSRWGTWTAIRRRASIDATAIYWHFLDGLWIYLLLILFAWR
jgi:cytochrome c oxidase subunit 3